MEEKYTKKELRRIKQADKLRAIVSITTLTLKKEALWEKLYCNWAHGDFYIATVRICGVDVKISYVDWGVFKHVNVSYNKRDYSVLRTRKNKPAFDYLASLIKKQITEREKGIAPEQPEEDTTMILPFPPEKDTGPTDQEKLQKVIIFLSKNE